MTAEEFILTIACHYVTTEKHGQHDQSTHGGKGGRSAAAREERRASAQANVDQGAAVQRAKPKRKRTHDDVRAPRTEETPIVKLGDTAHYPGKKPAATTPSKAKPGQMTRQPKGKIARQLKREVGDAKARLTYIDSMPHRRNDPMYKQERRDLKSQITDLERQLSDIKAEG